MRVLLVEDSARLSSYLARGFRKAGIAVDVAMDGERGLHLATEENYDVLVLDLMLPKRDGLSVLAKLRASGSTTHVLLLTAKDTVEDRVRGLHSGADDYLVKPFAFEELLARVQALARRSYGVKQSKLSFGRVEIDIGQRRVLVAGNLLALRPREYALLEYLALRAGQLVTRAEIEQHLYDESVEPMSNVVDSAICSLRRLLDPIEGPSLITTRRGHGYLFGETQ